MVSILYWRCYRKVRGITVKVAVVFQFSIGDAACRVATRLARKQAQFQFSIGDAKDGKLVIDTSVHEEFQFSIGDARLPAYGRLVGGLCPFQFSIGDARLPNATCSTTPSLPVSILYWRCLNHTLHSKAAADVEVSILYWRCLRRRRGGGRRRRLFQFSIGDAEFCKILNVWVFKFFVCVLAWWCLARLCGFPCLVCR